MLTYSMQPDNMANVLYTYVDADHERNPLDRKSVDWYDSTAQRRSSLMVQLEDQGCDHLLLQKQMVQC
jgi:hypothetical protein